MTVVCFARILNLDCHGLRPWLRSRWRLCRLTDAAYPLRVQSRNYRLRNDFERIRYIKQFC